MQNKIIYKIARFSYSIPDMRSLNILLFQENKQPENRNCLCKIRKFRMQRQLYYLLFAMNFSQFLMNAEQLSLSHKLITYTVTVRVKLIAAKNVIPYSSMVFASNSRNAVVTAMNCATHTTKTTFFRLNGKQIFFDSDESMPIARQYSWWNWNNSIELTISTIGCKLMLQRSSSHFK